MHTKLGKARRPSAALLGACLIAALVGCSEGSGLLGYTAEELYPENVRTVAVEIFESRTFQQGVEFDLTEALAKEIELRTPYKVAERSVADTLLTGTVYNVRRSVLSRTHDAGIPQEVQVRVTAGFEWKDMRTGQVIRKRGRIDGTGEQMPVRTAGAEPYETAQHEAVAELARDIVSTMRRDW